MVSYRRLAFGNCLANLKPIIDYLKKHTSRCSVAEEFVGQTCQVHEQ